VLGLGPGFSGRWGSWLAYRLLGVLATWVWGSSPYVPQHPTSTCGKGLNYQYLWAKKVGFVPGIRACAVDFFWIQLVGGGGWYNK